MTKNITLTKETKIVATGKRDNKNTKQVVRLYPFKVYASVEDAAEDNGVTGGMMSGVVTGRYKTCKGMRFCFLKDIAANLNFLEEIFDTTRPNYAEMKKKAMAYDTMIAEQEAKCKAEEERRLRITALKEEYDKTLEQIDELQTRQMEINRELSELEKEVIV